MDLVMRTFGAWRCAMRVVFGATIGVGIPVAASGATTDVLIMSQGGQVGRSVAAMPLMILGTGVIPAVTEPSPIGGAVLDQPQDDALRNWRVWIASPAMVDGDGDGSKGRQAEPAVQGVTAQEIRFGMVSAFTGAAKESGENLKLGVETAFAQVNDAGGIDGRRLKLVTLDDGYEPARTIEAMKVLDQRDKVFGFIGNFGTATAMVAAPYALEHKMLFFGAFTGATVLRRIPPDRYVFNYRPGYADETEATVKYLVKVRHIPPAQIAVFAQEDGFGDAGYEGVKRGLRDLRGEDAPTPLVMRYKRNAIDIDQALKQFVARRKSIKAVVMVATYRAAARFIEKTRDLSPSLIYTDVSGVGSTSLADELVLLGPKYADGIIVTQVVPSIDSYASTILDYKKALAAYAPGSKPDYVSLEGYIDAKLLIDGLRKAGPQLDTERLVDALEGIHDLDMGLGTTMRYGPSNHQASMKVWGTVLDAAGKFQPIDLD